MKISFDLDGTICDTDWGWLDRLKSCDWPGNEEEKYYACREKVLDPYLFLGIDDEGVILTGRPVHLRDITLKWLWKNGLRRFEVIFTKSIPGRSKGTYEEVRRIGRDKAALFIQNEIDVHFDDSEQVVKVMREALPDAVVIHVGHHVAW